MILAMDIRPVDTVGELTLEGQESGAGHAAYVQRLPADGMTRTSTRARALRRMPC